jgi:hypothetical protein
MAQIYRPRERPSYRSAFAKGTLSEMPNPPYAVPATSFRFAALATLAGKAPLGGRREVALAVYLAARLADDTLPERGVSAEARAERATHAKSWLSSMALPVPVRSAIAKLIEATAAGPGPAGSGLSQVIVVAGAHLDANSRSELETLGASLSLILPTQGNGRSKV